MRAALQAFVLVASLGALSPGLAAPLNPAAERALRAATFEIVVPKLADSESVQYERPPPWDLLPFTFRNDKFLSIGTAFAIGRNEFVTAAHVFAGWVGSAYAEPRLRAADGTVHEIGQVLKFSGHEDFIVFSLGDPPTLKPLPIAPDPELNTEVHAAGNALGEGIVIRNGLLTSETPEQQDGRWTWYRFSAAASPGNSGGPLVDSQGRVLGIVMAASPAENLNFALPIRRVLDAPVHRARMDARVPYQLPVMPFGVTEHLRYEFELPLPLADLGQRVFAEWNAHGDRLRQKLLAEHKERMFAGGGARRMMYDDYSGWGPSLIRYGTDGEWRPREAGNEQSASLPHGGRATVGSIANAALVRVEKPENLPLAALLADSRQQMDLTLRALNWSRPIGSEAVRIVSLGKAARDGRHADAYGRIWQLRAWRLEAMDVEALALILPVPEGFIALMRIAPTAAGHNLLEELKLLADLIHLSYGGTLAEWREFMALGELRPRVFEGIAFESDAERQFRYRSPRFELNLEMTLIDISDRARVELAMSYFPQGDAVVWDVGAFRFLEDTANALTVFAKRKARVPADIGGDIHRNWTRMVKRESPFNGQPYVDGDYPLVRNVFGQPAPATAGAPEPEELYEVGLTANGYFSPAMFSEMQQQLLAGFRLSE